MHVSSEQYKGNSKFLPFSNSQTSQDESLLPPIAIGGNSQNNSKNFTNSMGDTSRSNRSLQGQQLLNSKRRKKFKNNLAQDNTKKKSGEQVLRTYGLSGKITLGTNSEFNKSDVKVQKTETTQPIQIGGQITPIVGQTSQTGGKGSFNHPVSEILI
jgi:aconitase B